jgi:hypothetical protein
MKDRYEWLLREGLSSNNPTTIQTMLTAQMTPIQVNVSELLIELAVARVSNSLMALNAPQENNNKCVKIHP